MATQARSINVNRTNQKNWFCNFVLVFKNPCIYAQNSLQGVLFWGQQQLLHSLRLFFVFGEYVFFILNKGILFLNILYNISFSFWFNYGFNFIFHRNLNSISRIKKSFVGSYNFIRIKMLIKKSHYFFGGRNSNPKSYI